MREQIDNLLSLRATRAPRRSVLTSLAAAAFGVLAALGLSQESSAKSCRKKCKNNCTGHSKSKKKCRRKCRKKCN